MSRRVLFITMLAISTDIPMLAQERFSLFSPSSTESVERMLTVARLRDDDVIVDLGSGDGVIPLTAARMNPRLRGRGVEINPNLVAQSNQRAISAGVADRVRFEHLNAFDVDLRDATVVTMWLYPELMRLLRPIIVDRARPGTRVVTSTMGSRHLASRRSRPDRRRDGHLYVDRTGARRRGLGVGVEHRR